MSDTDALARRATIPQRLDRLPLTWTLWRLALVTQAGWALVVATDAIAARIYPFIWEPRHAFDTAAFSVLLLVSTGAGIVAGEYFFALLSDRFGRRRTLLAAAATCGLGTLPAGFVDDFWLLTLSLTGTSRPQTLAGSWYKGPPVAAYGRCQPDTHLTRGLTYQPGSVSAAATCAQVRAGKNMPGPVSATMHKSSRRCSSAGRAAVL
jgi:MFS family permease